MKITTTLRGYSDDIVSFGGEEIGAYRGTTIYFGTPEAGIAVHMEYAPPQSPPDVGWTAEIAVYGNPGFSWTVRREPSDELIDTVVEVRHDIGLPVCWDDCVEHELTEEELRLGLSYEKWKKVGAKGGRA